VLLNASLRVVLYARVSTSDKDQNPETQLMKLRTFAADRNMIVVGEFFDKASGTDPNRPKWKNEVKPLLRSGKADALVVVRLDRIMRSTKELLTFISDLEGWGRALICTDQPIETNTAVGRLMITLLGAFAEFEREIIAERVNDGLARARKEGKTLGRPKVSDAKASKRTLQRRAKNGGSVSLYANAQKKAMTESGDFVAEGAACQI
jgi:DNA invertase Pin-like site-specific DNA recombinase